MAKAKTASSHGMTTERRIEAPRARVFEAWTDPEQIRIWWNAGGVETDLAEIDLRVGGALRLGMRGTESGKYFLVEGVYREVDPPARLVHSWTWREGTPFPPEETLVTVEFLDDGDATIVRITHENFDDPAVAEAHRGGWGQKLDGLEAHVGA